MNVNFNIVLSFDDDTKKVNIMSDHVMNGVQNLDMIVALSYAMKRTVNNARNTFQGILDKFYGAEGVNAPAAQEPANEDADQQENEIADESDDNG